MQWLFESIQYNDYNTEWLSRAMQSFFCSFFCTDMKGNWVWFQCKRISTQWYRLTPQKLPQSELKPNKDWLPYYDGIQPNVLCWLAEWASVTRSCKNGFSYLLVLHWASFSIVFWPYKQIKVVFHPHAKSVITEGKKKRYNEIHCP